MSLTLGPSSDLACRLCWREKPLRVSHIIPAFVFRDLKKNSATGHMRFSDAPNKRAQDGLKLPWLCDDCEQLFSVWERKFANEVVAAWSDGRELTRYTDWLLKFCVSVTWRVLVYAKGRNPEVTYTQAEDQLFQQTELAWREFLLGRLPHPGKHEQHLVIWDVAETASFVDLPTNFNRFTMNAIMLDIVGNSRSTYAWAKLGRFQIFGTVVDPDRVWKGTKVHVKDGVLKPGSVVIPGELMGLYQEKAKIAADASAAISDSQYEKIEAAMFADLDRVASSRTMKAMRADAAMFGKEAIFRRPSRD
ncbi:hypothetical protein PFY01_02895 [Brevundimonas vesicularis]|uniref:hypothetical protein n=1 Tax=Brevundimonas vesicularis TaxID=41276 RepID=UPI0022EC3AB1|nr:hypothetical protein [Brevundimonas vesicularis]WBT06641.1 hypothetical protein PFY01_02895 [Brevundimonas vesicularis]